MQVTSILAHALVTTGYKQWVSLLKDAAREYDEHWLTYQFEAQCLIKEFEGLMMPSGGYTIKYVTDTAAEKMAEGQFNRFYILGLCKRARAENISNLKIFWAKQNTPPRRKSENLIGSRILLDYIEAQLQKTADSFKS